MSNQDDQLRYPIGRFASQESYTAEDIAACIKKIEDIPAKIEALAKTLSYPQLDTPYREGGWTARQVLHHLSDSHLNAYIRTKWTLTEDTPTIKAYDEKGWAETFEISSNPGLSIALLATLHTKWVILLKKLTPAELQRQFFHPDSKKHVRMDQLIATYAWHGEHHLGHLKIVAGK